MTGEGTGPAGDGEVAAAESAAPAAASPPGTSGAAGASVPPAAYAEGRCPLVLRDGRDVIPVRDDVRELGVHVPVAHRVSRPVLAVA